MRRKSTNKNILRLWAPRLMAASLLLAASSSGTGIYAMDSERPPASVHGSITREALGTILAAPSLKTVLDANDSQDIKSDAVAEGRRHFDGGNVPAALAYMDREKKVALNCAAEADQDLDSRSDALRHFGLMLHCAQDFYLRSNYVELALEDKRYSESPFDIPLVDWSKLPDSYQGAGSGDKLAFVQANSPDSALKLNKEGENQPESRKKVADTTYYATARELAFKETQRQWNLFETLIRTRCGDRSAKVLAALKKGDSTKAER